VIVSPSSTDIVFPVMVLEKEIDGIRNRKTRRNKVCLFRFMALHGDFAHGVKKSYLDHEVCFLHEFNCHM